MLYISQESINIFVLIFTEQLPGQQEFFSTTSEQFLRFKSLSTSYKAGDQKIEGKMS